MIRAWSATLVVSGALAAACGGTERRDDDASVSGAGGNAVGGSTGQAGGGAGSGIGGTATGSAGTSTSGPPRSARIDKLDLLLVIDNSLSMTDKQAVLSDAIPGLTRRLLTPLCLDASGRPTGREAGSDGKCANGEIPEFDPIDDIHVAVVSSSLGSSGGDICDAAAQANPTLNDRARPIGLVRPNLLSWDDTGFLAWDPGARKAPPGLADRRALESRLANMVTAVGDSGCGYEATLEAWYRFLIDPQPPQSIAVTGDPPQTAVVQGVDTELLALRARFLRPDSLVVIVMLTDENDCSISHDGRSWVVGTANYGGEPFRMPRATSICDTDPNHECCLPCGLPTPAGCSPDPTCESRQPLSSSEDHLNLRCYRQKQRFGIDLLHPISRYVDGLTRETVPDAAGVPRENPLYAGSQRDPSMVFLVGILGVPWADVAAEESWPPNAPVRYLSYDELEAQGRFAWMLAPDATSLPADGLMYETTLDRTTVAGLPQTHPGTGHALAPSGPTPTPGPNPFNGKETAILENDELQYVCIFPLPTPRDCSHGDPRCWCEPSKADYNRAICDGTRQTHAKAYPSIRQIEVLRGVGRVNHNSIIASVCPKIAEPSRKDDPSYGYTPAITALVDRLRRVATQP